MTKKAKTIAIVGGVAAVAAVAAVVYFKKKGKDDKTETKGVGLVTNPNQGAMEDALLAIQRKSTF